MGAGYFQALAANLRVLCRHPFGYVRGLLYAWELTGGAPKPMLMHTFYFLEAVIAGDYFERQRITDIHTHFSSTVLLILARIFRVRYSLTAHVEISSAINECRRVLREGGVAFFVEPLSNPLFDTVRNTRLIRRLWPNEASFERHITADERKLTNEDLKLISRIFPRHKIDRFRILSRLEVLFHAGMMVLEKLDYTFRLVPFYGCLAGTIVLTLNKSEESK